MKIYIVRKTAISLLVLAAVILIIFFINVSMPANITHSQAFFFLPREEKLKMIKRLHLDESKFQQLKFWIKGLFNGSLGYSYANGTPVTKIVKVPLLNSLKLIFGSFILSLLIAIPIGVLSATKQYSFFDYFFTFLALIGISLPSFAFASICKKIFLFNMPLFQFFAKYNELNFNRYYELMSQKILPFAILTIISLATLTRYVRSSMLEVVRQDYIRTARAKGLKDSRIYYKHALKNALVILLTIIGLLLPSLLTSTLFIEMIFHSYGLGTMLADSVFSRDYGLMMGLSIIISFIVIFSNYIVDICYGIVDPRIRYGDANLNIK